MSEKTKKSIAQTAGSLAELGQRLPFSGGARKWPLKSAYRRRTMLIKIALLIRLMYWAPRPRNDWLPYPTGAKCCN
ncbi:hypothetical protein O9992_24270 [Vibrio lentus]|nr:hypothetical protein [Vibrio lentus]